jgi:hypothetical protein
VETKSGPARPWEHAGEVLRWQTSGKGGSGRNPNTGLRWRRRAIMCGGETRRPAASSWSGGGPAEDAQAREFACGSPEASGAAANCAGATARD